MIEAVVIGIHVRKKRWVIVQEFGSVGDAKRLVDSLNEREGGSHKDFVVVLGDRAAAEQSCRRRNGDT